VSGGTKRWDYNITAAFEFFPEMNGLIYVDDLAGVRFFNETTDTWGQIHAPLPFGTLHNVAAYNSHHRVVLFGGGNQNGRVFYKIDKNGTVTRLADAPTIMGTGNSQARLVSDPVTGEVLLFDHDDNYWSYDIPSDTWAHQGFHPVAQAANTSSNWIIDIPISTHGIIMFLCWNYDNSTVILYKHAENPTPVTRANSRAAGNLFYVCPNPFNSFTRISFNGAPSSPDPVMTIMNIQGKIVDHFTISNSHYSSGHTWHAGDLPCGLYLLRGSIGEMTETRKIWRVK
jgi:hypothetical protein